MNQMPTRLERTTIYESDHVCLYTDKVRMPSGYIIEKYHQIHYPKEAVAVVYKRGVYGTVADQRNKGRRIDFGGVVCVAVL